MDFKKGIEVVGGAIIENSKGKILLVKSPKWNNKWTLPGGHIEPGEKIIEAVSREAEEEVGLKLRPKKIISFGELICSKDFHCPAHFIYFDAVYTPISEKVVLDNKELSDYIWIKPEKALDLDLAESFAKTIMEYLAYLKK